MPAIGGKEGARYYLRKEAAKVKKAYPIVMAKGEKYSVVYIPDFHINTQGVDVPDAIEMARDAIGLMGIDMQDDGEALPEASALEQVKAAHEAGITALVDVDFDAYRRRIKETGCPLDV